MELKDCPNCKKRISVSDIQCPYCKYIDNTENSNKENIVSNTQVLNYCFNCGEKLDKDYKCCPKCGTQLLNNEITSKSDSKNNGTIYIIICLSSYILNLLLSLLELSNSNLEALLGIVSLFSIITGKIKHPENKTINIIFWIWLIWTILEIILLILSLIFCFGAISVLGGELSSCPG